MSRFAKFMKPAPAPVVRRGPGRPRKVKNIVTPSLVTSVVPVVRPASNLANTTNRAGGKAFKMSDKTELTTTALCALIRGKKDNQRMYETEEARMIRMGNLMNLSGAEYAAKLALTLRIQHGLRSVSHFLAAKVAILGRGEPWLATFFQQVCVRPDDPLEILACYWQLTGRKGFVPNAMKKGFSRAFDKWDAYRLAKYAGGQRSVTLVDLANLTHPKPTEKNTRALHLLMRGKLKNEDTWEARLSSAKKDEKTKEEVWSEMIKEGKMGMLGLLRNLRNIATECNEKTIRIALEQLVDKEKIKKSGILPMQFVTAYEIIDTTPGIKIPHEIKAAIDEAVDLSIGNVPSLGDEVLIAIDESGSMGAFERDTASLFAAVCLKANPEAEVMFFATTARYTTFNRRLPLMELRAAIRKEFKSGSTNFPAIFNVAKRKYDSIVILSDQEGWMKGGAPVDGHAAYKKNYKCDPTIFCFDLGGDGSLMFREDSIILVAGYSAQIFKFLNYLKNDRTKMVDFIDQIQIGKPLPSLEEED